MEPERFGRYRLEELIGRGGMGEVHRAVDTDKDRIVAVKRLTAALAGDPAFQARFRRESQLAARLSHPHVVPIHDYGEIDGRLFIDMALIPGPDLAAVVAGSGPLPAERAVAIVEQVADALDAAHAHGLFHRDVKPSNVLLAGTKDHAYLVDFGIVGSVAADTPALTTTGIAVGTLAYMAPERFSGSGDHRVDVYALACVLFEMLTARRPFSAELVPAMLYAHVATPPPAPSVVQPGVPARFDEVIARGMAKDPDARFPSAGALAAAAREALLDGSRPEARPAESIPRAGARRPATVTTDVSTVPRRSRARRSALALAAVVTVGAASTTGWLVADAAGKPSAGPVAPAVPITCAARFPASATTPAVVAHITVGELSDLVAVSPDGCRLYVTTIGSVKVLDTAAGTVTASLPIGNTVAAMAMAPDGSRVYAVRGQGRVVVIDTRTNTVDAGLRVEGDNIAVAVSPDSRTALIANLSGEVSVVDTASNAVRSTILLDGFPQGIAYTTDGRGAYIPDDSNGKLFSLDPDRGAEKTVAALPTGSSAHDGIAVAPDGMHVYLNNDVAGTISVLDTATQMITYRIPVPQFADSIALSPDGRRLCAVSKESGNLLVIDTRTNAVTATVALDNGPASLAISPDSRYVYVTGSGAGNALAVVDLGA